MYNETIHNVATELRTALDAAKDASNNPDVKSAYGHAALHMGLIAEIAKEPGEGDKPRLLGELKKLHDMESSPLPANKEAYGKVKPFLDQHGAAVEQMAKRLRGSEKSAFAER